MVASVVFATGCGDKSKIDPKSAARRAIELYDTDGDAVLSDHELESCPGIKQEISRYDTDRDGQLNADEIANRIRTFLETSARLMSFSCSFNFNGRALSGAFVELVPEDFVAGAVEPAAGVTTADGSVELSVAQEILPEGNRGLNLVMPGVYRVRITHPKIPIPARYNTHTELGCEVSGEASNPAFPLRFELKGG